MMLVPLLLLLVGHEPPTCLLHYTDVSKPIGRRAGNKAVGYLTGGDVMKWEPWRFSPDQSSYAIFWRQKAILAKTHFPLMTGLHEMSMKSSKTSPCICSDEADAQTESAVAKPVVALDHRLLGANETVLISPMTAVVHFRCSDVPFIRWNM